MSTPIGSAQSYALNPNISKNASALQKVLFSGSATQADIQKISPSLMSSLTAGQIGMLASAQQVYFTGEQLSKVSIDGWNGFGKASVGTFTNDQVKSLGKNFILGRTDGNLASLAASTLSVLNK